MCNCIKDVTKTTSAKIKENIEAEWTVSQWLAPGSFQSLAFDFGGGPNRIAMPFVATYIRQKKDGSREMRPTNVHVNIFPSYCPFCGEKIEKNAT